MNRSLYFNFIETKLSILSYRIKTRATLNLLDLNIYCEDFYSKLLNLLFDYNLENNNHIKQNSEGIDLIDTKNKIVVQVSSTGTVAKIQNTLNKKAYELYQGYQLYFISLVELEQNVKKKVYKNDYGVIFYPEKNILSYRDLLSLIQSLDILVLKKINDFIKDELSTEIDMVKTDTNLAKIIDILSKENLTDVEETINLNCFDIEKKINFNNLLEIKSSIDEYKIYYSKLNEKYDELDRLGVNKSLSIYKFLNNLYVRNEKKFTSEVELFDFIIVETLKKVKESSNYSDLEYEELEMCIYIIVVDSFVKCKIFKNPEGYSYVNA